MKKIYLLLTILATVFTASAQYSMNGMDNSAVKSSQFSHKIAINEVFTESITVFPNPVVDVLKVSFKSSQNGKAVISFFNNIGKQAYSQDSEVEAGNNIVSIDIRSKGIEPGIYFVQIKIGIDVATRKLIVK
jgi:hypothetical protein